MEGRGAVESFDNLDFKCKSNPTLLVSNMQVPVNEQSDATVSSMATVLYLGIALNKSIEFAFKGAGLLTLGNRSLVALFLRNRTPAALVSTFLP